MKTAQLNTTIQIHVGSDFEQVQKLVAILTAWKLDAHLLSRRASDYSVQIDTTYARAANALDLFNEAVKKLG